jgi:hypothetical protein
VWLYYPIVACSFQGSLLQGLSVVPASYIGLYIDPVGMILDCLQADEESVGYLFVTKTVTDFLMISDSRGDISYFLKTSNDLSFTGSFLNPGNSCPVSEINREKGIAKEKGKKKSSKPESRCRRQEERIVQSSQRKCTVQSPSCQNHVPANGLSM